MSPEKIKETVLHYLEKNRLISIATVSENRPWSATTFFAYDKNLHILFFSRSDTRHAQNIAQNSHVSATINQVWGRPGKVKGIQLVGTARKLEFGHSARFFEIFRSRFAWMDRYPDHSLYIIEPTELWYLDHELFGHFYRVRVL